MPLDGSPQPTDAKSALVALRDNADNPSAFLALNQGNMYYSIPGTEGFICYRPRRRYWIQFGGPFCGSASRHELQTEFLAHAASLGIEIIALQLQSSDAQLLATMGVAVNQIGASYALELKEYTLRGKHFVSLRNKISRAKRTGLQIREVDAEEFGDDIHRINRLWLRHKGRHVKELKFLVGEIGGKMQIHRRLFMGTVDSTPVGYISYSPVFGQRSGWLHDLSRRHPDSPPGVMEALNAHAIETFRTAGCEWLHFGFTPFTGLDASHEMTTDNRVVSRATRLLADHGESVYPSRTQLEYKLKWAPTLVLPEYLAFTGRLKPATVWNLLRVTNIL